MIYSPSSRRRCWKCSKNNTTHVYRTVTLQDEVGYKGIPGGVASKDVGFNGLKSLTSKMMIGVGLRRAMSQIHLLDQ